MRNSSGLSCGSANTQPSSWIDAAEFCSDDSGPAYAIFELRGKKYIHEGIPESVWDEFTEALSPARFYDYNIRGQYRLSLDEE